MLFFILILFLLLYHITIDFFFFSPNLSTSYFSQTTSHKHFVKAQYLNLQEDLHIEFYFFETPRYRYRATSKKSKH